MIKKLNISIPARLESTRLHNKMLFEINKKSVIQRTVEQIKKSKYVNENEIKINVFTDSQLIKNNLSYIDNTNVFLTTKNYRNGTERISDNLENIKDNSTHTLIILGDQPYLNYHHIDTIIEYFDSDEFNSNEIITLYCKISESDAEDTSVAKIVTDTKNYIKYISRSKIPHNFKNIENIEYKKHVSIIIIPNNILAEYIKSEMSQNQMAEDNEWIKFIDTFDCKIKCLEVYDVERDVNTVQDLEYLINKYES